MRVYTIQSDSDRFRQFTFRNLAAGEDLEVLPLQERFDSAEPLPVGWELPEVVYWDDRQGLAEGDFPALGSTWCFSAHATEVLGDDLTRAGELLPLRCPYGSYFAFHVTCFLDALDRDASQIEYCPRTKARRAAHRGPLLIGAVKKHVFRPESIGDHAIFKLAGAVLSDAYVTDRFVAKVQAHGLSGFKFRQVWPPVDDSAEREHFRQKRLRHRR